MDAGRNTRIDGEKGSVPETKGSSKDYLQFPFGEPDVLILKRLLSSPCDVDILHDSLYHTVQTTLAKSVPHVASPPSSLYLICISLRII
jgi:hypothetical protein